MKLLKQYNSQRCKPMDAQIAAIEEEIAARIARDEQLAERLAIFESIPGISKITAFTLLIEMPEPGTMDGKQAQAWLGLRASLRQALYMPALVAARFNPEMKTKYQKLIGASKLAKIAITAIMRKLIVLANAFLRDRRSWHEIRA